MTPKPTKEKEWTSKQTSWFLWILVLGTLAANIEWYWKTKGLSIYFLVVAALTIFWAVKETLKR